MGESFIQSQEMSRPREYCFKGSSNPQPAATGFRRNRLLFHPVQWCPRIEPASRKHDPVLGSSLGLALLEALLMRTALPLVLDQDL